MTNDYGYQHRTTSDDSAKVARKSSRPRRVQKKTDAQDAAETGSQEDPRGDS
ncbi:hypothetical protein [uncultured Nocardioides sp.]|uniref:hypothetical protein n=1 Tax=uncultured Nocardioides sp. TaxID=198441 RepID=UPI00261F5D9C|nr:hypothetical protein [uncultured Nocardioides sp.]